MQNAKRNFFFDNIVAKRTASSTFLGDEAISDVLSKKQSAIKRRVLGPVSEEVDPSGKQKTKALFQHDRSLQPGT